MKLPNRKPSKGVMNSRENNRACFAHRAWIRRHQCSIADNPGHNCFGKIEAAHVRKGIPAEFRNLAGGTGLKPADIFVIPLCSDAHAEQHRLGEQSFSKAYAINMMEIALGLAKKSPHLKKARIRV